MYVYGLIVYNNSHFNFSKLNTIERILSYYTPNI